MSVSTLSQAALAALIKERTGMVLQQVAEAPLPPPMQTTVEALAATIDHTLLKPDATAAQIEKLCKEAAHYGFASVCVNPTWVPRCAELLANAQSAVCTVIGFPLGATLTRAKREETSAAIDVGAQEVDMVLNIGRLKDGDYAAVYTDIGAVVEVAHAQQVLVKVIIETCLLTQEEKIAASILTQQAGADFVKTSTGFSTGGATVADVQLMRLTVGPEMGIKAAGGVRSAADAFQMFAVGATRLGASAGVQIVQSLHANPTTTEHGPKGTSNDAEGKTTY